MWISLGHHGYKCQSVALFEVNLICLNLVHYKLLQSELPKRNSAELMYVG